MSSVSDYLDAAKKIIDFHRARADVPPKIQDRLTIVEADLGKLLEFVRETEGFIVLDSAALAKPKSNGGMEAWSGFTPGMHSDKAEIANFVNTSPLLDSLFRKGIDITKFYRFSPAEVELARDIGDRFAEFSTGLSEIRRARDGRKENEKTFLTECVEENGRFLDFLENKNIGEVLQSKIQKEDGWKPFRRPWFKNNEKGANVLNIFKIKDAQAFQFLRGEWLNAYVYNIMFDHLTRNRANFELYTNITYRAPSDVIRVMGEFDVLGLFRTS